jgi:hypothetical protein
MIFYYYYSIISVYYIKNGIEKSGLKFFHNNCIVIAFCNKEIKVITKNLCDSIHIYSMYRDYTFMYNFKFYLQI